MVRRFVAGLGLALPLALSACGTTVPLTQTLGGPAAGAGADGLAPGQTQGGAGVTAPGLTGAPGTTGQQPGSVGSTLGTDPGTAVAAGSVPSAVLSTARGVTPTTVTIGIVVPSDTAAVASSLGISGASTISITGVIDAVVKDVNAHGGVLGRKLVLYTHTYDAAAYISNSSQTIAEICADFRDDHKVFAVMFDLVDPAVRSCLAAMGSPLLVAGAGALIPTAAYAEHGGNFLFGPDNITTERLATLYIESLWQRSFFEKWQTDTGGPGGIAPTKLGLIHADSPDQNSVYANESKELAKHGLRFTDTVTYAANVQAGLAATQSAVLRFRADGITHVFGASAFFLQEAESQGYRPRYAYIPGLGALGVANVPAAQMKGAMTVGWAPTIDVETAQAPADTPETKHCRAVMKAAGMSSDSHSDRQIMYLVCDAFYALQAALPAGQQASVAGLRRGYEALGTGFAPAMTFSTTLGPNRHYGVGSVRDMAYDTACSCLKYTSTTNRS